MGTKDGRREQVQELSQDLRRCWCDQDVVTADPAVCTFQGLSWRELGFMESFVCTLIRTTGPLGFAKATWKHGWGQPEGRLLRSAR